MDSCCWAACTRHSQIIAYNKKIRETTSSVFRTVVTPGNVHEVNQRDMSIIAWSISLLSQGLSPRDIIDGPIAFNIL